MFVVGIVQQTIQSQVSSLWINLPEKPSAKIIPLMRLNRNNGCYISMCHSEKLK